MGDKFVNPFVDKMRQTIQNYMYFLIVIVMCAIYIFYGLLTIDPSGKSIIEIFRDGAVNLIFGWIIGKLLSMQGYSDGGRLKILEDIRIEHRQKTIDINSFVDRIEDFIKERNEIDKREYQISVLSSEALLYQDFIEGKLADYKTNKEKYSKSQRFAIYRAYHCKIRLLRSDTILNGENVSFKSKNDLGETQKENSKKGDAKAMFSRVATALFFGYFGISMLEGFNWANLIWTSIQAAIFLSSGLMRYFNAFNFMKDNMVERYKKQINFIDMFENWNRNNPRIIKENDNGEYNK